MILRPTYALACGVALSASLVACSPAGSSAPDQEAVHALTQAEAAGAEPASDTDPRARFLARCEAGQGPSPEALSGQAQDCPAAYVRASAAQPVAQALIAVFRPSADQSAGSVEALKAALPQVRWGNAVSGGSNLADGTLGGFDVVVRQRDGYRALSFIWAGPAGDIPVDVASALDMQAELAAVACYNGPDETGTAWRVTADGTAPFDLVVMERRGPSGTAQSSAMATVPLKPASLTLDRLRAEDTDWAVCG